MWTYDGSSTFQSQGGNSDMHLKPVAMYPDPFLGGNNKLVLCETYDSEMKPASNFSHYASRTVKNGFERTAVFNFLMQLKV